MPLIELVSYYIETEHEYMIYQGNARCAMSFFILINWLSEHVIYEFYYILLFYSMRLVCGYSRVFTIFL